MDAGIGDTLNRLFAQTICGYLDAYDTDLAHDNDDPRWYNRQFADTLVSDDPKTHANRAWLVGFLAARTPGVDWDGQPSDCDFDNLFSHFRAEILARRAVGDRDDWARNQVAAAGKSWATHMAKFSGTVVPRT